MIDESRVIQALEALLGEEAGADAALSCPVHLCCSALSEKLRKPDFEADDRVIRLAAVQCYRLYLLQNRPGEGDFTYVKAGDLTVRGRGNRLEKADALQTEALRAALPLLRDDRFLFAGV